MFARYARMSRAFNRMNREFTVAVKAGGGDPAYNARLRMAIQTARALNMPKDRIDAAIKRALSKDTENFQEVVYEAYGPHGVAIMIECATDNNTRTVANIRSILNKTVALLDHPDRFHFCSNAKASSVLRLEPLPQTSWNWI